MKSHKMPVMHEGGVNVTPLIDIVMCLIIFFMLVAKIGVNTGAEKAIVLPKAILGQTVKDLGNTIVLNVRAGPVDQPFITYLDTRTGKVIQLPLLDIGPNGQPRKPLLVILQEWKKLNREAKVIIRGDKDMPYHFLEPVLTTCAEAGVTTVDFATGKTEAREVVTETPA